MVNLKQRINIQTDYIVIQMPDDFDFQDIKDEMDANIQGWEIFDCQIRPEQWEPNPPTLSPGLKTFIIKADDIPGADSEMKKQLFEWFFKCVQDGCW